MKDKKIFLPKSELPRLIVAAAVIWVLGIAVSLAWNIFQLGSAVLAHICLLLLGLLATFFTARRIKGSEDEREKAVDLLREKEAAFSVITSTASEAIVMMNHEGNITYWNNAAEILFGYTDKEVIGKELHSLIMPERDREIFKDGFSEFRRTGAGPAIGNTVEVVAVNKAGNEFPVEVSISAVRIKGDFHAAGIIRDISFRKKAEEALRESERRYRELADLLPQTVYEMDINGNITFGNKGAFEMFGKEPEDLVRGLNCMDMIAPEDRERAKINLSDRLRNIERTTSHQYTGLRSDGSRFPIIVYVSSIMSNGAVQGFRGIIVDISERVKAEEDLLRLHRWNQLILDAAGEGIVGLDLDGKVIFANPTAAQIIGQKPDELIGDTLYHLIQHSRRGISNSEGNRSLREIANNRSSYLMSDEVFKRKDGTTVPVSFTNTPILEDGQVKGTVITLRDLTESQKIEEAKAKLETQLHQAMKMEAIGTLAGGIAHDFNNILAVIIGYSEIMLADIPETSPIKRNLEEVLKAGLRARDLVKQILVFSRMKTGASFQPTRMGPVVSESLKFLRASLPATIEIRQSIEDEDGVVLADATQIHQLLVNLCTNAFHAMEEKGGFLDVGVSGVNFGGAATMRHSKIKPGPYVKLTVADSGPGMDAATLERIFDPYFTTKGPGKGSGLGLAVVHGIVDRHDAVIEVQSEPGKGTSFHVFFPKIQTHAPQQKEEQDVSLSPLPRGNERILIVDDEEALADVERKTLEWLGYEVTAVSNSTEALALFLGKPDHFDLVITDYTMPKMTGAELAAEIIRARPDMAIIMCTGYTERFSPERAKEIGISEFLMKPLNRQEFAYAVRRLLDERK